MRLRLARRLTISLAVFATALCMSAGTASAYIINGMFPGATTAGGWGAGEDFGAVPYINGWQGKRVGIINAFAATPAEALAYMQVIWDQYRAIPMITYQPRANNLLAATGAYADEELALAAAFVDFTQGPDLKIQTDADNRRAYFRYGWEMNDNARAYSPCSNLEGNKPAAAGQFKVRWRRIHDLFRNDKLGSDEVAFVYSVSGRSDCVYGDPQYTYPGDAYVDWVGIDGYAGGNTCSPGMLYDSQPVDVFEDMRLKLDAVSNKPMSVNEVGVSSLASNSVKNGWINGYFAYLRNLGFRMSVWFNADFDTAQCGEFSKPWAVFSSKGHGDETYTNTRTFTAYSAYRQQMAQSDVTTTDTSNPRLMSTAMFLGQ